jgi:hypothetical protein
VLAAQSPDQLQGLLVGLLLPVQVSVARDTWITWQRGALAVTSVSEQREH